jgi:hypothetical protein
MSCAFRIGEVLGVATVLVAGAVALTSGDPICQPGYVQAHRFVDGKG